MTSRAFDLAFWINERYAIKQRREAGLPAPWTADKVMGSVRFCNVHREDDKVTRWLAVNWRPQYHEVWQILLARLINNIPTLKEVRIYLDYGDPLRRIANELKSMRQHGPIFGNAYTVSTNGHSMDKVDYIIDHVVRPARAVEGYHWSTLDQACADMCSRLNGVSTFMAGQIIADLKNTKSHPLQDAPDWATWAAPGPGSLRGLAAYFGRPVTPGGFTAALAQCYLEVQPLIQQDVPPIHMQDFQNCLCEFSKYVRVKEGGHARNRYTPA